MNPGDPAVLVVALDRDVEGFDALDRLLVFGPGDERLYTVPRGRAEGSGGPRRTCQQALGPFPQHGVGRVEAETPRDRRSIR